MTHTTSLPRCILGRPVTKSMQTSSHFHCEMGRGWRSPTGFWCSAFTLLHMSPQATKYAMFLFIPSHQKICRRSSYILVSPGCIEYEDSCAFAKIFFLKSAYSGTHILPRNLSVPSASLEKSRVLPSCRRLRYTCRILSSACAM